MISPTRAIRYYLNPEGCPGTRPLMEDFAPSTQAIHKAIDGAIRKHGIPYLHPDGPTLQLDMLGSHNMINWQESKAAWGFTGEQCWSDLPQFYARYGMETTRALLAKVRSMENASGAILTDCGMQAVALTFDALASRAGHAVLLRGVYNKVPTYLEWLAKRLQIEITTVDHGAYEAIEKAIRPETFLIFGETYSNPLTRAIDPVRLGRMALEARKRQAKGLFLVIDNTVATPWGVPQPFLDYDGVDVVVASGTKALAGQDRDLWGHIVSNRTDFLNEVMDLEAMRGGTLDWRRAEAILKDLDLAKKRFRNRCRSATEIARFLARHPKVESVYHPSLPEHPDRAVIDRFYSLPGSLLAFKIRGADEGQTRHFADVLATSIILRYAGSFDGLTTKINHHRTVSEYFTPDEVQKKAGVDRTLRLAAGLEAPEDIMACLNWAFWHYQEISEKEVQNWQQARREELGIGRTTERG
ncbi:MAG: PLP-dependent transferase [Acidiferrobacterales bacterium]